ncbi:MAG: cupin domain-containing protein [Candidatus Aminicenantes bacterium]|nr:cupin domain-containing protein [Candidatus Aminicenantes bacterium]
MDKINLMHWVENIKTPWEPKEVATLHDVALRIAKIKGTYDWHTHRYEDEMFLVLKGKIFIDLPDESVELNEMETYVVGRGIRHRSRSDKPAWVLLIEPVHTKTKGE